MNETLKIKLEAKISALENQYLYQDRTRLPRKLYYYSIQKEVENDRKIEALKVALKVVNGEKITPFELYTSYLLSIPESRKNPKLMDELYWNPDCEESIMRKAFEEIINIMCPIYKKKILAYNLCL